MVQFLPGLAVLIIEAALQISGYQNPHLAIGLLLIAAVLLAIPAWSQLKRLKAAWQFQSPLRAPFIKREAAALAPAQAGAQRQFERDMSHAHLYGLEPSKLEPPKPKYYSKTDKECLSDLYGELSQLLLANGANGGGGLYSALAAVGREFSYLGPSFQNAKPEQVDGVIATWQRAYDMSEEMRGAIYGGQGIIRRKEFLAYSDEIRAVLKDGDHTPLQALQEALGAFNQVLSALKSARKHNDSQLIVDLMQVAAGPVTDFSRATKDFQKWEFDANQRVQEERNKLRDG
ncbi:MAG TPA: hypothetical protein VJS47_13065 [Rhizomicrobium sp.]|nr:hypothetical protein [Rhizomicrobium sp.]